MKRCIAFLMAVIISFSTVGEIYASELGNETELQITEQIMEEASVEEEFSEVEVEQTLQTGLLETECVTLSPEELTTEPYEADLNLLQIMQYSEGYYGNWDKYSTNYFYNQLSEEERRVWDCWEVMCMEYMCTTKDATLYNAGYGTELVEGTFSEWAKLYRLARIFKLSNPQYYFLSNQVYTAEYGDGRFLGGFGIYTAFAEGAARETATASVKSQVDTWEATIANYSTEEEKVQIIHDLICEKVEYNYWIYEEDFDEDIAYTQTAYSVLCLDSTVCAGYAQAFQMMCNGAGIDTISVTSSDHQWNKVRVNDSWSNVDCTWSDGDTINYMYFERSDAYYDADENAVHHIEEDMWLEYLPLCTVDSNSTYYVPGELPAVTDTTVAPSISVVAAEDEYVVTIACATEGADIYYTLDGTEPSPAYTRSYKYTGPFMMDANYEVRAMAVCDTYWDSSVTSVKWQPYTYTVTFNANNANAVGTMADQTITYGSGITLSPNAFSVEEYIFVGWNTAADGTGIFLADGADASYLASEDGATVVLYAQWKKEEYNISYHLNGGTNSESNPATYKITEEVVLSDPTKTGYTFVGWYTDDAFTSKVTKIGVGTEGDLTLYAKWIVNTFTIVFDGNNANVVSVMPNQSITYGSGTILSLNTFEAEGYAFVGWNTVADGTGTFVADGADASYLTSEDGATVVLYAQWQPYTFTVTFNANNVNAVGTMSGQTITYGSGTTLLPNAFSVEEYVFAGWNTVADGTGTFVADGADASHLTGEDGATVVLYAQWKKREYNIAYHLNGGTNNVGNPTTYEMTEEVVLSDPTRTGYTFAGWYTDDAFTSKVTKIGVGTEGDINLYAKWTANTFKIAFYKNNTNATGTMATQTVAYESGTKLTKNAFTYKGYAFAGWNTRADGKGTTYANAADASKITTVNGATVKLYAQWKLQKYTITYNLNGGKNSSSNPAGYYITSNTITLKNPSRTGYTFAGWYSDSGYKTKVTQIAKGSTGNKTLYAKWTANTYSIAFNGNGATSGTMKNMSCKYPTSYTLTANAYKKTGYNFTGWNTKADGSGTTYKNKASVKSLTSKNGATVTLYAQWAKVKYTITYNLNNGKNSSSNPNAYYVTSATITLKNPSRTGYTFAGWYSDSKYKNKVTQIPKGSTGNKTLYAKWTTNTYSIVFNGNGANSGKMSNMSCKYPTSYTLTANSYKKTGYKFTGWNTKADGSGTSYIDKASVKSLTSKNKATVTLYAQWTKVKYTITYELGGGKNSSKNPTTYYVTSATIKLQNPSRTGYTFAGWYSDSKYKNKVTQIPKGSTGNKTLYAKWTTNTYSIVFNGNGATSGTMKNMSCKYPTSYTLTANAYKKTGYKFTGWNTKADGSGTSYADKASVKSLTSKNKGTVTLYAQWTKVKYTITYKLNGGTNNSSNPSYYYVTSSKIALKNPTRTGYTFAGWYSDSSYKNKVTQIPKGSTGHKTLYAKWKAK